MKRAATLLLSLCLILPQLAVAGVCEEWNELYPQIRDYRGDTAAVRNAFTGLHKRLLAAYPQVGGGQSHYYPVAGYDPSWGERGSSFKPKGYSFFAGNPPSRGSHPSHDLFIRDKNQDSIDDRSGAPVPIVAFSGGVVVGLNREWEYPSEQRGGKYVWVFDPRLERYYYYAHLQSIDVRLGQTVEAGQQLGLLGRTGKNAWMQRSPTHLHFMALNFDGGRMTPWNPWPALLRARLLPASAAERAVGG